MLIILQPWYPADTSLCNTSFKYRSVSHKLCHLELGKEKRRPWGLIQAHTALPAAKTTDIFDKRYQIRWLQRAGPKCRLGESVSMHAPHRSAATSSPVSPCLLAVSAHLAAHACTRFDASPGTETPAPGHIPRRLNTHRRKLACFLLHFQMLE